MTLLLTAAEESRFRRAARAERCPVKVIADSDAAPSQHGERAYHTWKGTENRVSYPGAALRKGFRLDYHPSTYRVVVGEGYVRRQRAEKIEKSGAYKRAAERLAKVFAPDAPRAVMADWLEETGDVEAAALLRRLEAILVP